MWATFEKNVLTPQDVARATINVDNSKCSLNVSRLDFFIEQRLCVREKGFGAQSYSYVTKLTEQSMAGPTAGQPGWTTEMIMDLAAIRYDVPEFKKKHGV